jgi:LacI family transcriptional regulator
VFEAAEELGYRPNSAAQMLKRGETRTIGLVVSDDKILRVDAFVPRLFQGITGVCRQHGYHVLLESVVPQAGVNAYENLVEAQRIDGLLVLSPRSDDQGLVELIESDYPVVLAGSIGHAKEYSVNVKSGPGIYAAVDRLVELGHRDFGTVTFSPPGFIAMEKRLAAIGRALARHALEIPPTAIAFGDFSAESGYVAARKLLLARPSITALLAGNDTIAIGCLRAAAELGRRIPEDLSLVGFDDLPFADFLTPRLTTVRVDAEAQGGAAAELLLARIQGKPVAVSQLVVSVSKFVERQSTSMARVGAKN